MQDLYYICCCFPSTLSEIKSLPAGFDRTVQLPYGTVSLTHEVERMNLDFPVDAYAYRLSPRPAFNVDNVGGKRRYAYEMKVEFTRGVNTCSTRQLTKDLERIAGVRCVSLSFDTSSADSSKDTACSTFEVADLRVTSSIGELLSSTDVANWTIRSKK